MTSRGLQDLVLQPALRCTALRYAITPPQVYVNSSCERSKIGSVFGQASKRRTLAMSCASHRVCVCGLLTTIEGTDIAFPLFNSGQC